MEKLQIKFSQNRLTLENLDLIAGWLEFILLVFIAKINKIKSFDYEIKWFLNSFNHSQTIKLAVCHVDNEMSSSLRQFLSDEKNFRNSWKFRKLKDIKNIRKLQKYQILTEFAKITSNCTKS